MVKVMNKVNNVNIFVEKDLIETVL